MYCESSSWRSSNFRSIASKSLRPSNSRSRTYPMRTKISLVCLKAISWRWHVDIEEYLAVRRKRGFRVFFASLASFQCLMNPSHDNNSTTAIGIPDLVGSQLPLKTLDLVKEAVRWTLSGKLRETPNFLRNYPSLVLLKWPLPKTRITLSRNNKCINKWRTNKRIQEYPFPQAAVALQPPPTTFQTFKSQ